MLLMYLRVHPPSLSIISFIHVKLLSLRVFHGSVPISVYDLYIVCRLHLGLSLSGSASQLYLAPSPVLYAVPPPIPLPIQLGFNVSNDKSVLFLSCPVFYPIEQSHTEALVTILNRLTTLQKIGTKMATPLSRDKWSLVPIPVSLKKKIFLPPWTTAVSLWSVQTEESIVKFLKIIVDLCMAHRKKNNKIRKLKWNSSQPSNNPIILESENKSINRNQI